MIPTGKKATANVLRRTSVSVVRKSTLAPFTESVRGANVASRTRSSRDVPLTPQLGPKGRIGAYRNFATCT
jgi:hypothetical protein